MSCYHPQFGVREPSGRVTIKPHINMTMEQLFARYGNAGMLLPCQHCIGCRLDYSRRWADRCLLELQSHQSAYFVTLTYNDDHLPISSYIDDDTGEVHPAYTLRLRDLQLFYKRLRERFGAVRHYSAGEYGDKYCRPHYHCIIFGLELQDLVPYKRHNGYQYYTSEELQKVWSIFDPVHGTFDPIGYVVAGKVTWESCAYVARYATKKLNGEMSKFYAAHGLKPEFAVMSRRPGIACAYYDEHKDDITPDGKIYLSTIKGGKSIKPPKYYDKFFEVDCPDELATSKELFAKMAIDRRNLILSQTDLSYEQYLLDAERRFKDNAVKQLKRSFEHGTS